MNVSLDKPWASSSAAVYTAVAASSTDVTFVVLGESGRTTAGLTAGSAGSIVNDAHNNPTDIGSKRFLTEGTVFLSVLHASLPVG